MTPTSQRVISSLIEAIRVIEEKERVPPELSVLRPKDERRAARRRAQLAVIDLEGSKMLE